MENLLIDILEKYDNKIIYAAIVINIVVFFIGEVLL